ncbi:MAG TPA: T9SS type A sorting domain-containing protein, partial [Chitinophagales bacterium]|nr:T9SS type A sorting domain-containing protein [Chitinophagales bacterium]
FQRTDSNVVQFVFDSINLVDSFRNERLSHGFVKFKIQQKANNPDGTKIYNKADIYFDYNTPITTNKTMHTIGRDFVQVNLISGIKNTQYHVKAVKVYPNPFREQTQIMIECDALKNPVLILQTLEGQIIKSIPSSSQNTFDVYREGLTNGMYIFKVVQNNEQIASGKLVIQ